MNTKLYTVQATTPQSTIMSFLTRAHSATQACAMISDEGYYVVTAISETTPEEIVWFKQNDITVPVTVH